MSDQATRIVYVRGLLISEGYKGPSYLLFQGKLSGKEEIVRGNSVIARVGYLRIVRDQ